MAIIESAFGLKCVVFHGQYALDWPSVTQPHASTEPEAYSSNILLIWNGGCWQVYNNSNAAIFVGGTELARDCVAPLTTGDEICFGAHWYCRWRMLDASPPQQNVVFISGNGHWYARGESKPVALNNGDVVATASRRWCLCRIKQTLVEPSIRTAAPQDYAAPVVLFQVSADEEHVFASIEAGGQQINLHERAHHYLLVTLARSKLQDHRRGLDSSTCGWIEMADLSKMLALDIAHINIQIYRARKQIAEALFQEEDPPRLIERRLGSIRLGDWGFKIMRGSSFEGEMLIVE